MCRNVARRESPELAQPFDLVGAARAVEVARVGMRASPRLAHPSPWRYAKTYSVIEAIYGSPRLSLPFEGLLLIGY